MTERRERIEDATAALFAGTFSPRPTPPRAGDLLPPGWEGLYFGYDAPLAGLREDGSPDADLPAVGGGFPRRLYAGEDTTFHRPLRLGQDVVQRAETRPLADKTGRSGRLVFVDVERTYSVDGEVAVTSVWHDVFLESGGAVELSPDGTAWEVEEPLRLDPRQLFRFSALTFNTHRIHYDRDWARDVEGLPDLLVHGPLVRILLLDLAGRSFPDLAVARAEVRMLGPVLVDTDVRLVGRRTDVGAEVALLGSTGSRLATARLMPAPTEETPIP